MRSMFLALVIAMVNWVQVARIVYTETRGLVERELRRGLFRRSLGEPDRVFGVTRAEHVRGERISAERGHRAGDLAGCHAVRGVSGDHA